VVRGRRRRRALGLAAAVALGLPGCSVIDAFTFFPTRELPPAPPGVEDRTILTPDGERLHAWHLPGPPGAPLLLWSHGNAGNIGHRAPVMLALARRGLGILAYDYRGYGRSTGRPSEQGVYTDALAAHDDAIARGADPARIVCFGESLGGAVAVELARRRACGALAVVSTFTRLADVGRHHYGPLGLLAGDRFDALGRVAALRVPLLVAHAERDEIVPLALGRRLYEAAAGPKRFLLVPRARHNDVLDDPTLLEALAGFAREAVAARR
jgi:hypothetical protein